MLKSKGSTLPGYSMSALFVLEGVFISHLGSMLHIEAAMDYIGLPEMDGYEPARGIRQAGLPMMSLVALTG